MYPVSQRFLDAAASPDAVVVQKVDVWNQNTYLETLPLENVLSWSVSSDETRPVRRTATLSVQSQGRSVDQLVPVAKTDLLHPSSGNELRIYQGFRYTDGKEEYAAQGVFRQMAPPKVKNTQGTILISISGSDRSAQVSAISWESPFVIAANTDVASAVFSIIDSRYPGLVYNLTPTNPVPGTTQNLKVPAVTFGTNISSGNDPMADGITLATAVGMEEFFGVLGELIMRPIPDPTTAPVVAKFVKSGDTPWLTIERDPNQFGQYNGVICIGNGTGGPPVQAAAWDTNPDSPTYYLGPWGKRPYFIVSSLFPYPGQTVFNAIAQAQQAASARLQLILRFMDGVTVTTVPNPALQEGDCVYLYDDDTGVDGNYVISSLPASSDVTAFQTLVCRPQRTS